MRIFRSAADVLKKNQMKIYSSSLQHPDSVQYIKSKTNGETRERENNMENVSGNEAVVFLVLVKPLK